MINQITENQGVMISVYIHQPVELPNGDGTTRKLSKGMAEIPLEKLEIIKDQVGGEVVTFILPIKNRYFFQKSINQWIYNFLMMFQAQQVAIEMKAQKGDDGHTPTDEELQNLIKPLIPAPKKGDDGHTPTETEITAIIKKVMPQVPVIKNKAIPLTNIAVGLREQQVTWDTPFESTNYFVIPTVNSPGAIIALDNNWITDLTKSGCKIRLRNVSLSAATGTLICTAISNVS